MPFTRQISVLFLFIASIGFVNCHAKAAEMGGDFSLLDQDGSPFQLQQLRGKVVLLFFGYTYCPDVCPTELSNISAVLSGLEHQADQVQGLFITLDAERDKPKVLKDYTGFFNKDLIGLTGSQADIDQVAAQYRVKFQKHITGKDHYSIDHSANLYVIDRNGQLATVVPYGFPPEHVLDVVQHLLDGKP
ncbi:MAG: SCO family protein [Candidatus Thiodiazotropha sp. (ex Lucinoma kastoroae)]|nr:SCO family protein [Candidatus Thiodiazotropha sp. (ex Lucinoma kastoroae)]MCU7861158.1 SCO family protein [Candidatus Thiodiazotropha sp. (ex Lucinoma kastoroae)]